MAGNYLLDTSTILWALAAPEHLSPESAGRNGIRRSHHECRLVLGGQHQIEPRATIITALNALPTHHNDPFDRVLIAQANEEGLTLLTSDKTIARYPVRTFW